MESTYIGKSPGLASTVVEHSLHKIFVHKATGVRISPRTLLFRLFTHQCLTEIPTTGQVTSITQPRGLEKAVATSLSMKKEHTFRNWPYDVMYLDSGCISSYYPTTQTLQILLQQQFLQPVTTSLRT